MLHYRQTDKQLRLGLRSGSGSDTTHSHSVFVTDGRDRRTDEERGSVPGSSSLPELSSSPVPGINPFIARDDSSENDDESLIFLRQFVNSGFLDLDRRADRLVSVMRTYVREDRRGAEYSAWGKQQKFLTQY